MSRIRIVMLGLSVAAGLAAATTQAQAGSYNFTTYNNPNDVTFNQLLGINNAGTVAGYFGSGVTGHPNQGYTFVPPSSYTSENFPGSLQTQVIGINNKGTTVGFWANSAGANFGFADNNGTFTNINDPNTPASSTSVNQLLGVNDSNIAVGFYTDAAGNFNGYTYAIGTKTFTAINDSAATSLTASGINNNGEIAGFYTSAASGATLGFLDVNGKFTSVNPTGSTSTSLFGINNNGIAVGTATFNGVTDGIVYDTLNQSYTIVNDPNGVGTTIINGINDSGVLAGFYVDAAGNTNGFLGTPVPEPGSLALLGIGLLALIVVRRR